MVCPWNRFAAPEGDPAFSSDLASHEPPLIRELGLTTTDFNPRFKNSPIRRPRRRGYLRNVAVALGNTGTPQDLPALDDLLDDPDPMLREHAAWAIDEITNRNT
jgi:epoxyqueuosine reductase